MHVEDMDRIRNSTIGNNNNNNNGQPRRSNSFSSSTKFIFNRKTSIGTVAVQKLRESKWFQRNEERLFCAVIEYGFIVEFTFNQETWFGVITHKIKKDKKPTSNDIVIYTIKITGDVVKSAKILKVQLCDIWNSENKIRINNFGDKENAAHPDKDIKEQISFAQKTKKVLWNNSQHFAFFCRYGAKQQETRSRHLSESLKWGTLGMHGGFLMVRKSSITNAK